MAKLATLDNADRNAFVDPVCGMNVASDQTDLMAQYRGCSYYFCAEACRQAFEKNPEKYLGRKAKKKKGWFGRYLERLSKANEQQFGGGGPKCH